MDPREADETRIGRRDFSAMALSAATGGAAAGGAALAAAAPARAQKPPAHTSFHVAVGAELRRHAVDPGALTLAPLEAVTLPAAVQYAWQHPALPILYVAYSNRGTTNDRHGVQAFRIGEGGALTALAEPLTLDNRPIHLTVDPSGRFLLVAFNAPSELRVHGLREDGTIAGAVRQAATLDFGIYAHQVRVAPSGALVVLQTRGNDPTPTAKEDPGAIKVFRFRDGQLSDETSVAENGGIGFGPRHVDFHPTLPRLYASMERGNQLLTYGVGETGLSQHPLFTAGTVKGGAVLHLPVQYAGAIHLHPDGRTVYVVNRSDGTVEFNGAKVHGEGENSVAVFRLDAGSGEPVLAQTADTRSYHCRTFAIYPDGRMLVTASVAPLAERDGDAVRTVPARLTVFSVDGEGRLTFARTYDVDTAGGAQMFWCGMVTA
ncbi:lactonase family protein [Roseomonas elaeocarpi]|uniref:Lactonase family protein n=1 Tax=Roseomonas elaeocarpi TaxID=907779 RepID=A0ABV6JVY1_9PROT